MLSLLETLRDAALAAGGHAELKESDLLKETWLSVLRHPTNRSLMPSSIAAFVLSGGEVGYTLQAHVGQSTAQPATQMLDEATWAIAMCAVLKEAEAAWRKAQEEAPQAKAA